MNDIEEMTGAEVARHLMAAGRCNGPYSFPGGPRFPVHRFDMMDDSQYPYTVGESILEDALNHKILIRGQLEFCNARAKFLKDTVRMLGNQFGAVSFKEPRPIVPVPDQQPPSRDQQPVVPDQQMAELNEPEQSMDGAVALRADIASNNEAPQASIDVEEAIIPVQQAPTLNEPSSLAENLMSSLQIDDPDFMLMGNQPLFEPESAQAPAGQEATARKTIDEREIAGMELVQQNISQSVQQNDFHVVDQPVVAEVEQVVEQPEAQEIQNPGQQIEPQAAPLNLLSNDDQPIQPNVENALTDVDQPQILGHQEEQQATQPNITIAPPRRVQRPRPRRPRHSLQEDGSDDEPMEMADALRAPVFDDRPLKNVEILLFDDQAQGASTPTRPQFHGFVVPLTAIDVSPIEQGSRNENYGDHSNESFSGADYARRLNDSPAMMLQSLPRGQESNASGSVATLSGVTPSVNVAATPSEADNAENAQASDAGSYFGPEVGQPIFVEPIEDVDMSEMSPPISDGSHRQRRSYDDMLRARGFPRQPRSHSRSRSRSRSLPHRVSRTRPPTRQSIRQSQTPLIQLDLENIEHYRRSAAHNFDMAPYNDRITAMITDHPNQVIGILDYLDEYRNRVLRLEAMVALREIASNQQLTIIMNDQKEIIGFLGNARAESQ